MTKRKEKFTSKIDGFDEGFCGFGEGKKKFHPWLDPKDKVLTFSHPYLMFHKKGQIFFPGDMAT